MESPLQSLQRTLFDPVRTHIAKLLLKVFESDPTFRQEGNTFDKSHLLQSFHDALTPPPANQKGDLAFGCFQLAKSFKKNPVQIAQILSAQLKPDLLVSDALATGPYLNFTLKPAGMAELFFKPLLKNEFNKLLCFENPPKTMIEFSQPNTHKELHVGHMRNACLGDSLVKVLRKVGFEVISSTFPGDQGTHVAKCLWYLKNKNQEAEPNTGKGEWLGKMYSQAHLLLEDQIGSPLEEKNREELTDILRQLESKSGEYYDLWLKTRQWSIDQMLSVYNWLGISFDHWYWESEVDAESLSYVNKLLSDGKLVRSQGAVGMDLNDINLGFCMLLKSDGTGLYATKDLELARRKFRDFNIDRSVYVVDLRQALHFQQIFAVLKRLGFEKAENCYHLQYNFVELPDGAMSSRKGNIVPLTSLTQKMQDKIRIEYLSRYNGEWSSSEIDLVAAQVAQGAIKYGMVKIDNNKKIVFDMQEWLRLDGDSGPFIQYSAARIQSLLDKVGVAPDSETTNWDLLQHESEHQLMSHLLNSFTVLAQTAETYRPSIICTYLFETAQKFNRFYHDCSVMQAESQDLRSARLCLCKTTLEVLKLGLEVLGIPVPKRM